MNIKSREILFMARRENYKTKIKDKWLVEGYPFINGESCVIMKSMEVAEGKERFGKPVMNSYCTNVERETISQYTGREDMNGKKIWEYSIVRAIYDGVEHYLVVIFDLEEDDFKAVDSLEGYSNFAYLGTCEEIEVVDHLFYYEDIEEVLKQLH